MLDEGKIAAAVKDALGVVGSESDCLVRLVEYMQRLEADPHWTPAEISAFQAQIARVIAHRSDASKP